MTERIYIREIGRILKYRKDIEKSAKVRLNITKGEIEIDSDDAYEEYLARRIIEALNYSFDFQSAVKLKSENFMMDVIRIKEAVRPSRIKTVLGRLIGEKGRTKKIISELSDCSIAIKDYDIAIIGTTTDVPLAIHAINSLIHGAPHSSVYAYLEKNRRLKRYEDEMEI